MKMVEEQAELPVIKPKKEVCTRTWYSYSWQFVLRCKDSTKAEKMAICSYVKGCENYSKEI